MHEKIIVARPHTRTLIFPPSFLTLMHLGVDFLLVAKSESYFLAHQMHAHSFRAAIAFGFGKQLWFFLS